MVSSVVRSGGSQVQIPLQPPRRELGQVIHSWLPVALQRLNLQAIKQFIVTSAAKEGVVTTPLRFRVRFKILYRVIHPLIQHCLLPKMVYFNIIYFIATRNYEFFTTHIFP